MKGFPEAMHEIENNPNIRTREQLIAEASAEGAGSSAVLMGAEVLCESVRAKLWESDDSSDDSSSSRPKSKLPGGGCSGGRGGGGPRNPRNQEPPRNRPREERGPRGEQQAKDSYYKVRKVHVHVLMFRRRVWADCWER